MVNRQTGYTPNRLMLGRETIQPVELLLGVPQQCQEKYDHDSWARKLADSLQDAYQHARENLRSSQARQKRDYDLRAVQKAYNPGDVVYKLDSSTKIGKSSKLRSPWIGPFLVTDSKPPIYRLKDRKGEYVLHHDRLKLCLDRNLPMWLRRLRHDLFSDKELPVDSNSDEEGSDPNETIPYCGDLSLVGLGFKQEGKLKEDEVCVQANTSGCDEATSDSVLGHPASPEPKEVVDNDDFVSMEGKDTKTKIQSILQKCDQEESEAATKETKRSI